MSSTHNLHIDIEPKAQPERVTVKSVQRGECTTLEISACLADDSVNLFLWGTVEAKWQVLDAIIDACNEAKANLIRREVEAR